MDNLWAPWRVEYIRREREDGCFLCRALAGADDRRNLVLKRGEHGAILLNRYPYSGGHLMVVPCRHVRELDALSEAERLETMALLAESVNALRRAMRPDGFNVGINLGAAAGAGLAEHLHTHVVPRWKDDTNFMPVLADTRVVPQALEATWDLLRPLLNPAE